MKLYSNEITSKLSTLSWTAFQHMKLCKQCSCHVFLPNIKERKCKVQIVTHVNFVSVLQERLYYLTTIHNLQIYLSRILQNFFRLVWKTTNPLLNCGSSREHILLRQCSQTACFEWFSLKNTRFFPLTSNIKIIQGFKAILLQH